jgi:hypothetical protein
VNTRRFAEVADDHLLFELRDRQYQLTFTDQLRLHILELPKFGKSPAEQASPLDVWLYLPRHAEQLDTAQLSAALQLPEVHRAML